MRAPAASRHAASTRLRPIALLANGTVREARGFASRTKTRPSARASWTFRSPTTPSAGASRRTVSRTSLERSAAERRRRQDAGGVARVHAGLLDVLHDGRDVGLLPVAEGVDVDLDRAFEEAVDEHAAGALGRAGDLLRPRSRPACCARRGRRTGARAPDSRSPRRPRPPPPARGAIAPRRHGDAELAAEGGEALAVLGEVDGVERASRGWR